MKRVFVLLLCIIMIFSLAAGCGKQLSDSVSTEASRELSDALLREDATLQESGDKYFGFFNGNENSREVVQVVSSLYSPVFAALYDDGTVGVGSVVYSGYESDFEGYAPALEWTRVKKLYLNVDTLVGLREDGSVVSVSPYRDEEYVPLDTAELTGVVDVVFMEPTQDYFFLLEDGTVVHGCESYGAEPPPLPFDDGFLRWTEVDKLISYYYYDVFAIFEDGSVRCMGGEESIPEEELSRWSNIRELYFDSKFYGLRTDGSVVIYDPYPEYSLRIPDEAASLSGAARLYPVGDVVFGLTDDGDLLVSGGAEWFCEEYNPKKSSGIDWSAFTDIRELTVASGLDYVIALKNDGSVISLNQQINPYLSYLTDIEELAVACGYDGTTYICGIRKNGKVVGVEILPNGSAVVHKDDFRDWEAADLYATPSGILIGFCADGSIVSTHETTDTETLRFMTSD